MPPHLHPDAANIERCMAEDANITPQPQIEKQRNRKKQPQNRHTHIKKGTNKYCPKLLSFAYKVLFRRWGFLV
ncbi:MAG: hypothetical protein NWE98_08955 [Candidatus Bathyarchaeota archaeon]|nr:hypothetical protein [Candidatus Bathyarchaeota archaeon]